MAEVVDKIAVFIESLILAIGYPGIFAIMLVENVFPPVPTDPLLPFAGMLAGQQQLNVALVWVTAVAGAIAGSLILYTVGKRAGEPFVRSLVRRYGRWLQMSEHQLDEAFALYNRYGASFVLIGRSIPVLRSVVSLTAGVTGMRVSLFVIYSALNSLLVTGFWIFVGYLLGENWREVLAVIGRFEPVLTPVLIAVAVIAIGVLIYRRTRSSRQKYSVSLEEAGD